MKITERTNSDNYFLSELLSLPTIYNAKVSYDSKWVAWSWDRLNKTCEIYLAAINSLTKPIRLSNTPENTYLIGWSPDSRSVLVKEDVSGNERYQIFRIYIDQPLIMEPLTEETPNYFITGGELHKNGEWLIYGANIDLVTGKEIKQTAIIRHNIITGERKVLACPVKEGINIPTLSPNGDLVLYCRRDLHPAGSQLWLVDINGNSDHEIINIGPDKKVSGSWLADGKTIVVLGESKTYKRVGVWSKMDGLKWLLDDPKRQIESVIVPCNSSKIIIQEINDACLSASVLDPYTQNEIYFPKMPGTLNPIAEIENNILVGTYNSSTQPFDIVSFNASAKNAKDLNSISKVWSYTKLNNVDLIPAENFRWFSEDGTPIQGWLYLTKIKAIGTIIYVHGGPTAHSADQINNLIQFLVKQGFNVLDPNYRGSTGFGLSFCNKIKEGGWGDLEQIDIRTGIQALVAHNIAKPGKIGITGTSYGGYSAWHAITHFPLDIVCAAAPICGMTDLIDDYKTTKPELRPFIEEMMGGTPEQIPQKYHERSPINYFQNIKGKLFIIHGMKDPLVNPNNIVSVEKKLSSLGVKYDVLTFNDEGHGIRKIKNQQILYCALVRFFSESF